MTGFTSFMDAALDQARAAANAGEVPVGALIVRDGQIIAQARNRMRELTDPTAHAEMLAIRAASQALGSERLTGAALDRLTHRCHIVETKGESYRLQDAKRRRRRTS